MERRKIALLSSANDGVLSPYARLDLATLRQSLDQSDNLLSSSPRSADWILFVGSGTTFYSEILASDIYKENWDRVFMFDLRDLPIPILRGAYMTLPHDLSVPALQGFYPRVARNEKLDISLHQNAKWLGWFRGAIRNHPVRRKLLECVHHNRIIIDDGSVPDTGTEDSYAHDLLSAKFIICPRGVGASTFRVFEAMRLGRAPVIISDQWREPPFVDWESFAIRIAESQIEELPEILESRESDWKEMGERARSVWLKNFSISGAMNWLCESFDSLPTEDSIGLELAGLKRQYIHANSIDARVSLLKERIRTLARIPTPFQSPEADWSR